MDVVTINTPILSVIVWCDHLTQETPNVSSVVKVSIIMYHLLKIHYTEYQNYENYLVRCVQFQGRFRS